MMIFTLADREYAIDETNVEAICVFGSFSRGEADELSDIDILVLADDKCKKDSMNLKILLSNQMNIPIDWLSIYSISAFEHMAEKGSYFLWHLKLEGKILYSKTNRLSIILEGLKSYTGIKRDLEEYSTICEDIGKAIESGTQTINYELSLLASIIRNTCITISYMDKKYLFGRVSPVEYCLGAIDETRPFEMEEYINLYNYRIKYIRSSSHVEVCNGTSEKVRFWIEKAKFLINYAIIKSKGSDVQC